MLHSTNWRYANDPDYRKKARKQNNAATRRFRERHPDYEKNRWVKRKRQHNLKRNIKRWAKNLCQLKTCNCCGAEFRSSRAKLKTCSDECRNWMAKYRIKEFHKRNPDFYPNRKKGRKKRTPPWADMDAIKFFYDCCPAGCHVDHIIPLRGKNITGLHVETNLQWLPEKENLRKGNSF